MAAVRGRGIARAVFGFAAEHADYLRCDTHEDNAPMRRALTSFGFRECGTITVANGTQRVAYDWLKEPLDGSTPASPTAHLALTLQHLPNNLARNSSTPHTRETSETAEFQRSDLKSLKQSQSNYVRLFRCCTR